MPDTIYTVFSDEEHAVSGTASDIARGQVKAYANGSLTFRSGNFRKSRSFV